MQGCKIGLRKGLLTESDPDMAQTGVIDFFSEATELIVADESSRDGGKN
jgi:hypothetical protein